MATAFAPKSFQSSQLSRDSRTVFAAAEHAPVTITRRDGEPLALMPARSLEAESELHQVASQLIAAMRDESGEPLHVRLARALTWMQALSDDDQRDCASAVESAIIASLATSNPRLALSTVWSWRGTAEAIADGLSHAEAVDSLDDLPPVERP